MIDQVLNNMQPETQVAARLASQQSNSARSQFEDLMRISTDRIDLAGKTQQQQVQHLTNQFVSVAFIQPMMEQMRDSPFKSELFSGGSAGDMFQQHLDTILADRISQRANLPIAKVMYERITGNPAVDESGNTTKATDGENPTPNKATQGIDRNG